jgi:AcrR family transcriptional regulator
MSPGAISYAQTMSRWKPDAAGRLIEAALTLFDEHGYEAITVAEIAARAGLTKRTFFRYFADKREVLFRGSEELRDLFVSSVAGAPPDAGPFAAVETERDAIAAMFTERHPFARTRARIIATNPELQERELIKLESLAEAVAGALRDRGVPDHAATLAAQTGITVFHVAFGRWVAQDDSAALQRLMRESLEELRALTAV